MMRDMVVTINRDDRVATSVANEQEKERREKRNVAHDIHANARASCALGPTLSTIYPLS